LCGISFYVGNKPANIDKIKILGIYNITRGSDACGIVINNTVKKGIDDYQHNPSIKEANFTNFIEKKELTINESDENYTVIVHNRKASTAWSEKKNPDHAHPFEITDPDGNIVMIGAHNGSIQNCDALKKEFDMSGTYPVDSQLMLSILAKNRKEKNPYSVLEKYIGNAVLVWFYLDEPNTLYVWKGASKLYSHSELVEERPMFVWEQEPLNSLYFSSIKEALYAIGGNETNVFNIEVNRVYKFVAGKKAKITIVNRDIVENENFTRGSGSGSSTDIKSNGLSTSRYNSSNTRNSTPVGSTSISSIERTFKNYPNYKKVLKAARKLGGVKTNNSNFAMIEYEPFTFDPSKKKSKVYFHKGRYFQNGHMIGVQTPREIVEKKLDYLGFEKGGKIKTDDTTLETYYFYMGFLLKDKTCADQLQSVLNNNHFRIILKEDGFKTSFFLYELVRYVFGFACNLNDDTGACREWDYKDNVAIYANGKFCPLFDYDRSYYFVTGQFCGADYDNSHMTENAAATILNKGRLEPKIKKVVTSVQTTPVIILPESTREKVELDKVDREEFINAGLDFVKDGENIDKEWDGKITNSELEPLLLAIKRTTKHVKNKITELNLDDENDVAPYRGLLYS